MGVGLCAMELAEAERLLDVAKIVAHISGDGMVETQPQVSGEA